MQQRGREDERRALVGLGEDEEERYAEDGAEAHVVAQARAVCGVGLLVGTVFAMLASLTLWVNGLTLIPKGSTFNEFSWSFDSVEYLSEKGADILKYGMMSVMIVYFYALSFLRMKETEV